MTPLAALPYSPHTLPLCPHTQNLRSILLGHSVDRGVGPEIAEVYIFVIA